MRFNELRLGIRLENIWPGYWIIYFFRLSTAVGWLAGWLLSETGVFYIGHLA
jgi:hypothetical protein